MCRKLIFSLGGMLLVGGLLFGKDAVSYVSTAFHKVQGTVKESVPVEFEIDRARQMVKDLVPEIRKNMQVIAKEEVEVERLERQIKENEERLNKDRTELMKLKSDVASGKQNSSIIWHHEAPPPPMALDQERHRFAVAVPKGITVIELRRD